MSDVNANIGIVFDTKSALASLRQLQAGLSKFNQSLTSGNINAANAQKGLNAQLVQSINSTGKFVASQRNVINSTTSFTSALEKNKLSMREYYRYTAAAATANTKILTRAFSAERDIINRTRRDRVKSLQSQYVQLTNSQGDLVKVLQVVPKHLEMVNRKYTDYATRVQMAAQRQQLMNQLLKQGSTQLLNFGKNTQWAGRQLMVGLTIPLSILGSFAAQTFKEMEEQVVAFKRVYGDMFTDGGATDRAVEDIQRLGREFTKYGIAAKDTMNMAAKAAAMGLTGSDLNAQVIQATRLGVLGQVEQQQALETTISLQNAFGISADNLAAKINFLNAVENQTVLSIEDLTIAIPKAGPVVNQLGGSVEDLTFFMTAMKEGGINASEGANALKSGLASLINPSTKASAFLGTLGINIKGIVEANVGDLKSTVIGFAQALDTLDPLNRARAIEQLFGKFQFARLSTLFQNVTKDTSQAARALGLAGASIEELAILSERELGRVEDAVGVKFQKTIEELKLQIIPVGKAFLEALTPVVAFFGKVLEKFNNFSEGTKKTIAIVVAVVAGLAPIALMTFGLLANGLANIIKFFALLRGGMAKLNGQNNVLGAGFDYLTQQELENVAQSNALHTAHQGLIETFNVESSALSSLSAAYANAASQARALAAASPGLFNTVPGASGAVSGLKMASGGLVPGKGNSDSVPAMLTPGEAVITKNTVASNPKLIGALLSGKIKGFNEGGVVGGFASQIASRVASSGANTVGIEKSLEADLAKILKRAAEKGLDPSAIESQYKKLVTEAVDSLDQLNAHTKESFKKLRDEALKPLLGNQSGLTARYQQDKTQYAHVGLSESMPLSQVKGKYDIRRPDASREIDTINAAFAANNLPSPTARVVGGAAMSQLGSVNRVMAETKKSSQAKYVAENGPVIDNFMQDFEKIGAQKWKATTNGLGITFDNVQKEFEIYDAQLLSKVQAWKASNPDGFFNDEVFAEIENQTRVNATDAVREIMDSADRMLTGIRTSMTDAEAKMVTEYAESNNLPVPKATIGSVSNRKVLNAEKRTRRSFFGTRKAQDAGVELGSSAITGVRSTSGTNAQSTSRKAEAAGVEVSEGLVKGMKKSKGKVTAEASSVGSAATNAVMTEVQSDTLLNGTIVDEYAPTFYPDGQMVSDASGNPLPPRQAKKMITNYKRGVRREKVGRFSGKAAGGLGTAAMVAGMAGAPAAVTGALGGASMVASMAPMLAGLSGPQGIVLGLAAAAGGLYLLNKSAENAAKAQTEFANSTQMNSNTLKAIGEATGRVGATEIMSRRRQEASSDLYTTNYERQGGQFGTSFLESDAGKSMANGFSENLKLVGKDQATAQFASNLALAVSDGVMTAVEASDVARQMAINFGDMTLLTKVDAQLNRLIGPYGEDLIKDPLQVRIKLIDNQAEVSGQTSEMLQKLQDDYTKVYKDGEGLAGYSFGELFRQTENEKVASFSAASGVNNLSAAQSQMDAYTIESEKKIKELEAQRAITTEKSKQASLDAQIRKATEDQAGGQEKIREKIAETLEDQLKIFRIAQQRGAVEDSFFDSLKESVRLKYKGTAMEGFTGTLLNQSANLKSKELEVTINTMVASGQTNPMAMLDLLEAFSGDEEGLKSILEVAVKTKGADKIALLISNLGGVKSKTLKKELALKIADESTESFNKINATLTQLQTMDQKDFNINLFLGEDSEKALIKLQKLQVKLDAVENIPDPITKTIQLENIGLSAEAMVGITANWEYFMSLPETVRKTAIQTYVSAYETVTPEAVDAIVAKKIKQSGGADSVTSYYNSPAGRAAARNEAAFGATEPQYSPKGPTSKTGGTVEGTGDKNKDNTLDFLDSLAMRLKQVRDNSFNALTPVQSLLSAFTSKKAQKDASEMFSIFDGIQNKLLKMGVSKDFRDAINSMSAQDFNKVANLKGENALFTFKKGKDKTKDNITGLTKTGKATDQGYREASLGEFNLINEETVKNINNQNKAYRLLIANGLSASDALAIVADEGQAAAIAGGAIKKSSPDWKKYVENIKSANTALEKQAVLNAAIKSNEDFEMYKKMPDLVTKMRDLGYSIDQIDAVLGDPALAKFLVDDLKDGKIDATTIADQLNSIEARKIIDIQISLNQGDYKKASEQGRQLVEELFAVQEELIRTGSEGQKIGSNSLQIADLQAQIAPFQRAIALINDKIQDAQRGIDVSYTRPIEKLQEEVSDLNRELEMNPLFGDRAIKKIQEENTIMSNDLSIISNEAEKINKKYDEQAEALSKVQEINQNIIEQNKQQLDLADALTQGDISAAAKAAQTMRATSASAFAGGQSDALDQARQNALKSLTGPQSGLTQEQIAEKQFKDAQTIYQMENNPARVEILSKIQIKQDAIYALEELRKAALISIKSLEEQIFDIQENQIEPLQEKIDLLEYENTLLQASIDKQIASLNVLGNTKTEWNNIFTRIDASSAASKDMDIYLQALLDSSKAIDETWADILSKIASYTNAPAGGQMGDASYVQPQDTPESVAALEDFIEVVSALDKASVDLEAGIKTGNSRIIKALEDDLAKKQAAYDATLPVIDPNAPSSGGGPIGRFGVQYQAYGGMIKPKYFAVGGYARGTDTVPAMLTPGEFVMSKYAVQTTGLEKMKAINSGSSVGDSVYNYSISVNVKSDADANEIARSVMTQIKNIDSQQIRGTRV